MNSNNQHIIKKVRAELTVADHNHHRERSERLKQAIQNAVEQLGPKMDQVSGDSLISIDLLSVETGIKESNISKLEEILVRMLSEKLDTLLLVRKNVRKNAGLKMNVIELSKEQNQKEILSYFLLTGRLPWRASSAGLRDSEKWLKQLTADDWLEFIEPIMEKNAEVPGRLAAQFSDSAAENIIKKTAIAQYRIDDISPFIHELLLFAKSKKITENEYRRIKVELFKKSLSGMLSGAGNERIFRSLLAFVIRVIGSKKSFQPMYSELKQWMQKKGTAKKNWPHGFEKQSWTDISSDESKKSTFEQTSSPKTDSDEFTEEKDSFTIYNAGVVILHPFLTSLFKNLGYTEDGEFVSLQARERAVCLVHYLATGNAEFPEHELLLAKFLCGWPLAETVDRFLQLSGYETEECNSLLANVIQHWEALKNTSPDGLQKNFLQREGILKKEGFGWTLYIENKTHDILLDKLPWGFSIIKLKWMEEMLTVNWK